MNLIHVVR